MRSATFDEAIGLKPDFALAISNRGSVYHAKGDLDRAMVDYNEAIRLDPNYPMTFYSRGVAYFGKGEFNLSAADFAHRMQQGPADPSLRLWLYLAHARAGDKSAAAELESSAKTIKPSDWPYPAIEMFLGRRQASATLAATATPAQRCEALFYIGEWQLLQSNRAAAVQSLKSVASSCPLALMESRGARSELKRLAP
jgi:lipoprotein NlpI